MSESQLDYSDLDGHLADLLDAPHWYVGFSGGVDSTVLLHLLQRWCQANPAAPSLTAIHINHGMQTDADDWQVHCEWVCDILQVPCICRSVDVKPAARGGEAAARDARYRVFEEQMQAGDVLFLGHHLDDQVETFFLRLLRGAGVQGLAAIPVRRNLGQGSLDRPLLSFPRAQIERYAADHGLQYVEDPSNSNTAMDRNFLRAELLPLLATRWPGYRQTVARASEHMGGAITALQQALPTPDTVYSVTGDQGITLEELVCVPREAAAIKLRSWLLAAAYPAPDQTALEEFLRQLAVAADSARPRLQCSAYTLQRFRDAVYLLPPVATPWAVESFALAPGELYEIPGGGRLGLQPVDSEGLVLAPSEHLRVDWRQGGERCHPVGRSGSNRLKKLLQEYGVPPWWRERVPLLYLGDELLAVGDLWLCQSSRWREAASAGERLWLPRWQPNPDAAFD